MNNSGSIWLVEPFYTGSHKLWADSLGKQSNHKVTLFQLSGRHWKFRMQASAYELAVKMNARKDMPDLILTTDMVSLPELKGYLRSELHSCVFAIYMHENQITYPWSPQDKDKQYRRDRTYGMINIKSYLAADHVFFNSHYHLNSYQEGGIQFLTAFPEGYLLRAFKSQLDKASVLPIGMDLTALRQKKSLAEKPTTILWNHRWEYDKQPEEFFQLLEKLKSSGQKFQLIVCGSSRVKTPDVFEHAKTFFKEEIIHWGFAASREHYYELIGLSDLLPVTANQDFFGISVVEAIAGGCIPILPKRLAYPEHIPKPFQKQFLYRNESEAFHLLQMYTASPPLLPKGVQDHIHAYDWQNMIKVYDRRFAALMKREKA